MIYLKILLVGINAKFIHTCLALKCLKSYAVKYSDLIFISEYTINNEEEYILQDIYEQKPDVILFSAYIWNIELIKSLGRNLKKLLPHAVIGLGGPEVSYDAYDFLAENGWADLVMQGEGEETFSELLDCLTEGNGDISDISGLSIRKNGKIINNGFREPIDLNNLPFMYDSLDEFKNKIIYYESQRGCPFNCKYCLSSNEKKLRFLNEERVKHDLDFFLKNNVMQVKFVDRTFNCSRKHAHMIWKYLMENDNGITNFHMEITGDLIDDDDIELLKNARKGLFQFEIGVQSTNIETLNAIDRKNNLSYLKNVVRKLKENKNIHLHLDLIAGLPYEGYESFKKSFNDVYSFEPNQLQLGFLKLLKGSSLRYEAEDYGIVYSEKAPYEVLYTNFISYDEIIRLKFVTEMVETYYNSGKASAALKFIIKLFDTPFDFYEGLGDYWKQKGYHKFKHNKAEVYDIFYEFCGLSNKTRPFLCEINNLLKLDMLLNENAKSFPDWIETDTSADFKNKRKEFFGDAENEERYLEAAKGLNIKQKMHFYRIEKFDYDVLSFFFGDGDLGNKSENVVLFDYTDKDAVLNAANTCKIIL